MRKFNVLLIVAAIMFAACERNIPEEIDEEEIGEEEVVVDTTVFTDWTEETHGNSVEPDYDIVFNQNEVLRFDIVIDNADWIDMQDDLEDILGSSGGRPGMPNSFSDEDPMWVECSVFFKDKQWYSVGIRYKGNSSLQSAYQSGVGKLSFKLDFDEWEDEYPEIKNQRFYGFKQLNLKNNYADPTCMREKVGADLFREFGLASSQTAFCAVYVDYGSGPKYFGLYALVEEVDDTVIETQFSSGSGNLYKPDGDAASFANGTFDEDEMEIKTNEDSATYSDVRYLYDVLQMSERTSDTETWKSNLESILDVDVFLKWLAANTVIQNWDTYGIMTHNYYLYNDPSTSLLTWIPWDNNEAFQSGKNGGALSFSMSEVSSSWPLISYLLDVEEYETTYHNYLQSFIETVFVPSEMIATYEKYASMIGSYVEAEESGYTFLRYSSEFDSGVSTLKTHVQSRNDAVVSYLN